MGGLRGRLRNLERTAEGETMLLVQPETGEEVRVPFDAPTRWLVAEWSEGMGAPVEPDPVVEHLASLIERGFVEKHPDLDGRILSSGHEARGYEGGA